MCARRHLLSNVAMPPKPLYGGEDEEVIRFMPPRAGESPPELQPEHEAVNMSERDRLELVLKAVDGVDRVYTSIQRTASMRQDSTTTTSCAVWHCRVMSSRMFAKSAAATALITSQPRTRCCEECARCSATAPSKLRSCACANARRQQRRMQQLLARRAVAFQCLSSCASGRASSARSRRAPNSVFIRVQRDATRHARATGGLHGAAPRALHDATCQR